MQKQCKLSDKLVIGYCPLCVKMQNSVNVFLCFLFVSFSELLTVLLNDWMLYYYVLLLFHQMKNLTPINSKCETFKS